ncbi:MAG: hypothetical protein NT154_13945 [Verrucomicrobia bacterium]|nr:hypothetical protein [Verrucomicrobiota bacterium]
MPQILRRNLPRQLYAHLLERVQQRQISGKDLTMLIEWLDRQPEVPQGKWFKRFPGMILCGEGELVKTFLVPSQAPMGQEVP